MATVVAAALILGVTADVRRVSPDPRSRSRSPTAASASASDKAPATDVLAEWSRIGKTEVLGAELVEERVVTGVKLEDVPEGEALEAILGKSFGFVEHGHVSGARTVGHPAHRDRRPPCRRT